MNQPMIIWCVIAGVLLLAFVLRSIERHHASCGRHAHKPRHIIEIGRERDMFYIPGDTDYDDDADDL